MELPKVTIDEASLTPTSLAKKLKEDPSVLLKELKEEKGIFEDSMKSNTILAWDTVQRACERRGLEAVDNYNGPQSDKLSNKDKEALRHCISFHKMYAELIVESLPKDNSFGPSTSKLAEYHRTISQAVSDVLEKIEKKERLEKNTDIGSPSL